MRTERFVPKKLKSLPRNTVQTAFRIWWQRFGLAHLSLFEVVKDVLCILRTHVTVLRVLRVDVKLLWDLRERREYE